MAHVALLQRHTQANDAAITAYPKSRVPGGRERVRRDDEKLSKDRAYYQRNAEKCKARSRQHYHTVGKFQRQARTAAKKAAKLKEKEEARFHAAEKWEQRAEDEVCDRWGRSESESPRCRSCNASNESTSRHGSASGRPRVTIVTYSDGMRQALVDVSQWLANWGGERDQWKAMVEMYSNDYRAISDVRYQIQDGRAILDRIVRILRAVEHGYEDILETEPSSRATICQMWRDGVTAIETRRYFVVYIIGSPFTLPTHK
ncbi:hypothetical protein FISHEDRAFT_58980 [Fistulina hepatica ATCC 64428]|uniref:Uncharacterized protein n=1 Tax=Fistulina hepatica ATCC 64428 TaxID=1128425 RepID=A0A0D7ABW5_9AGAR|nr:hypothetical protein FISHEDRAFT_58980 [Fistulina hepatica ATCC 64428]